MLGYILLIILVLWLVKLHWANRHAINMCKQLKSDIKALPIFGHIHYVIGNNEHIMAFVQRLGREALKHGGLTYTWTGSIYLIVAADPVVVDSVSKSCLEKHEALKMTKLLMGNGLIIAPVPIWRQRRKVIVPIFNQKNLNYFTNHVFTRQSSTMVDLLKEFDGTENVSVLKYFNNYTLDSVCETVLGVQMGAQHQPDQPFFNAFEKCCQLMTQRLSQPWLHHPLVYKLLPQYKETMKNVKIIWDFIDQIIQTKRKQIQTEQNENDGLESAKDVNDVSGTNSKLKPLLEQILLGNKSGLTDLEIREEMLVLILAATDTSAVAASFTAVMLSRHQDVQEKVYEELQEVFGDSNRPIVAEDLLRLKYLEAVIKETLRLYPPGPLVTRNVEEDTRLPSGLTMVKGTGIMFHIWAMHRNPEYWGDDADVFRPERFFNISLKHPAAFMPFSFGPRNCPGYKYAMMSTTTVLANILRKYQLLPASLSGAGIPDAEELKKPLRVKISLMLKHVDGFKIRIQSRK